jgi:hypothetical protein
MTVAWNVGLQHTVRVVSSHSAIQWGTVSSWVAGLLTSLSLLLAIAIMWRDRGLRVRAQAMEIACWAEFDAPGMRTLAEWVKDPIPPADDRFTYTIHIANQSRMPINQPMIFWCSITKREARRRRRWEGERRRGLLSTKPPKDQVRGKIQLGGAGRVRPSLLPGESIEHTLKIREVPPRYLVVVHFGDSLGRFWAKDVRYGTLYRAKRRLQ